MNARELLAQATARPWGVDTSGSDGAWGIRTFDGEQGVVVDMTGYSKADGELLVRAVNEYEALLDVEAAVRMFSTSAMDAALARLDGIRGQQ